MAAAFFRLEGGSVSEILHPLPPSASGWSQDQVRGPAVSGALARATERTADQAMPGMGPTRWAVDLYRPARFRPTMVITTVIKKGRRIGLIDAEMQQEGRSVARSRALFARASSTPANQVWKPEHALVAPPPDLLPFEGEMRLYYTENVGWTTRPDAHRNDAHLQIWHWPLIIVEGEQPTPFQLTATVADVTSLVVNWGSAGLEHINVDIDLALTRLPTSMELGLSALDRSENSGIATGTVIVFDRDGPLGSASIVALANPGAHVHPTDR